MNVKFIAPAKVAAPILVASPHSGRFYPKSLLRASRLGLNALRNLEDCYVDEFGKFAPNSGLAFITTDYARAYVDLNRNREILDYRLIENLRQSGECSNTAAGFGVIPRAINNIDKIYEGKITYNEAQNRITKVYNPYHKRIEEYLNYLQLRAQRPILVDIHSMPDLSLGNLKADFVIGNRFGNSCSLRLTEFATKFFEDLGFKVRLNHPYAGGFSTIKYANAPYNAQTIQIEINRKLYMNEESFEKKPDFIEFQNIFKLFFDAIAEEWNEHSFNTGELRLSAE